MSRQHVKHTREHHKLDRRMRKLKRSSGLFIAPSFLGVLAFFFIPFLVVIFYSLVDNPISMNFVFLDNFRNVVQNAAFRTAVHNTAVFSAIAVPLAVVLSLLLAIVLESKLPFRSQFRTFFLSPMMVPVASIVLIWQVLFHYNGAVNDILGVFGVEKIDWLKSSYSIIVIVILFLWKNLGYNMILFMAALASIPNDLLEVARLESATPLQTFFYIKIRYLSSTFLFVTIMSLISSFKIFREIYLLTTDYPYDSIYMLQHFMNNKFKSLDYQTLSAAAILMSLVMIVIIGLLFAVENHFGKDVAYIPSGAIATKLGRKKAIMLGLGVMALCFLSMSFVKTAGMFMIPFFVIIGFGYACVIVNTFPIIWEMSKGSDIGKYTGFYYTASMTAQIVTPTVAGFLIEKVFKSYAVLFPYALCAMIISFLMLLNVKHGDSKPEAPKDKLEALGAGDD